MRLFRKSRRPSLRCASFALLAACHAAGGERAPAPPSAAAVPGLAGDSPSPANEAAFLNLRSALARGDDELAARILVGLRERALSAPELELVARAERVLTGRALVRGLELDLVSEPVPDAEGSFRLALLARSQAAERVRLKLPPCDLKRRRATMDARGVEGLDYESRASSALRTLELLPGVEQRVELLTYELPLGRALAVRERWRLEPRSGEIESGGNSYPAAAVPVASCERERFSPLLAPGAAASTALAGRLAALEPPSQRELLELALRTPRAAHAEALCALAPVVARLAREAPERVQAAEPALRWLTQNRELGQDAGAWARYLAARALDPRLVPGARTDSAPSGGLDLPERPRSVQHHGEEQQ